MHVDAAHVPFLPADEIRRAIAAHDWTQASELMTAHQHEVAARMGQIDWSHADRGPWRDLLSAQRELMAEVRHERDVVAQALSRLNEDQRGARAWLKELG